MTNLFSVYVSAYKHNNIIENPLILVIFHFIDAIHSSRILAAKYAVMLLTSKSGESSTISIPTIPLPTACFKRYIRSILDKPLGVGTETPGANAGSRQSRSTETYFLSDILDINLSAIFKTPTSAISIGVTMSNPTFSAFSISSGSAALMHINILFLQSSDCVESVSIDP